MDLFERGQDTYAWLVFPGYGFETRECSVPDVACSMPDTGCRMFFRAKGVLGISKLITPASSYRGLKIGLNAELTVPRKHISDGSYFFKQEVETEYPNAHRDGAVSHIDGRPVHGSNMKIEKINNLSKAEAINDIAYRPSEGHGKAGFEPWLARRNSHVEIENNHQGEEGS